MRIRKMMPEDVRQVAAIERDEFSQPWSEQGFLDSLDNPDTLFLVAEDAAMDESRILGYVGMYCALDEGEITNVAAAQQARRRGVGKALIGELLRQAKERGICRIILEVRVSNTPAIRLYEGMQFYKVGTRKGFYDFPKEDAGIMVWEKTRIGS